MYFAEVNRSYIFKWWYYAGRGIVFLLISAAAFMWPQTAAGLAVMLFAFGLIVDGVVLLLPTVLGRTTPHLYKIVVSKGVLEVAVGAVLLINDVISVTLFSIVFGLTLIFRGVLEFISFVETPTQVRHQRLALLSVVVSVLLGLVLISTPFQQREAVGLTVAVYALVVGVIKLATAWRMAERFRDERASATIMSGVNHVEIVRHARRRSLLRLRPRRRPVSVPAPAARFQRRDFLELPYHKYRRPIVFAPHPDDLEGFAGGLVYRLKAPVISVIFAGGNLGVWSKEFAALSAEDYIDVRLDESVDAGRLLGVNEIIYMGYRDREVVCDDEAIERTLEILREHRPDLVVSFEYHRRATPYAHPDHLAVADIVRRAVARYERHHELDFVVTATFLPNRFVDISDVRRVKLEALACHTTQAVVNAAIFPFFEKMLTRLWGAYMGVQYAEGYRLIDIDKMMMRIDEGHV